MNPFRHMSSQFNVIHHKRGVGQHELTLTSPDNDDLASVYFFHHNDPTMEPSSRIEIGLLGSNVEGQGHAKRLMQHLYDRYPKSFIDWGMTINPASTHLAEHFENKYYNRTSYQPAEDID